MAEYDADPVPGPSLRRRVVAAVAAGVVLVAAAVTVGGVPAAPTSSIARSVDTRDEVDPGILDPGVNDPGANDPGPPVVHQLPALVVPTGAIDLTNATIDLPTLPENVEACQGRRTFAGTLARGGASSSASRGPSTPALDSTLRIEAEWVGSVDGDGVLDTLALIGCDIVDTAHNWQVVAVGPSPDGTLRTIGQVLASGPAPAPAVLFGLTAAAGVVTADVGDFLGAGDASAAQLSGRQQRGYRLDAGTFRQVSGPTRFAPNPNFFDISVTAGAMTFAAPTDGGARAGTLAVSVHNAGPAVAGDVVLVLTFPGTAEPDGTAWDGCGDSAAGGPLRTVVCPLGSLAAGRQSTLNLGFLAGPDLDTSDVRVGEVHASGTDHLGLGYSLDVRETNDSAPVTVVLG